MWDPSIFIHFPFTDLPWLTHFQQIYRTFVYSLTAASLYLLVTIAGNLKRWRIFLCPMDPWPLSEKVQKTLQMSSLKKNTPVPLPFRRYGWIVWDGESVDPIIFASPHFPRDSPRHHLKRNSLRSDELCATLCDMEDGQATSEALVARGRVSSHWGYHEDIAIECYSYGCFTSHEYNGDMGYR